MRENIESHLNALNSRTLIELVFDSIEYIVFLEYGRAKIVHYNSLETSQTRLFIMVSEHIEMTLPIVSKYSICFQVHKSDRYFHTM
jgi:hypothetical protein